MKTLLAILAALAALAGVAIIVAMAVVDIVIDLDKRIKIIQEMLNCELILKI